MTLKWNSTIPRKAWVAPSSYAYGTYRIYKDDIYSVYMINYYYTDGNGNLAEVELGSRYTLKEAKAMAEAHHA